MKNNGLLLLLLAVGAYFLTQKKTGDSTNTNSGECMTWGEASVYLIGAWLRAGRLPSTVPNLSDFFPTSGAICITKDDVDRLVRESL